MKKITLSYILTTYNKIDYLKITLPELITACEHDEEIIITDGGSTDGTVEYLNKLFKEGKIHQFTSEKDTGEAHGTNKAILMANGELIKLITDDDAFFYPGIQVCKIFMLENPQVDVLAGNIGIIKWENPETIFFSLESQYDFCRWMQSGKTIFFCGLSLMLRRRSLARTGLFSTGFTAIDVEFTTRISRLNVNLAWCKSVLVTAIVNPKSNSVRIQDKYRMQEEKTVSKLYNWDMSNRYNTVFTKIINGIKTPLRPLKHFITGKKNHPEQKLFTLEKEVMDQLRSKYSGIQFVYSVASSWLVDVNKKSETGFLYKK